MQHPIFVIYKNLPGFLEARKLTTTHQFKYDEKGMDEIINNMEKMGFMDLKSTDGSGNIVELVIIYANSEYSHKTPKLKQLISTIESSDEYIAGKVVELIYIVDNDFLGEKRLVNTIREKTGEYVKNSSHTDETDDKAAEPSKEKTDSKVVSKKSSAVPYIRLCPYSMFIMNMVKTPIIPKSRIMTPQESKKHLKFNRKTGKDIHTIDEKVDAIVTWLGAKKGDLIEHEILSRNCGFTVNVRRVI